MATGKTYIQMHTQKIKHTYIKSILEYQYGSHHFIISIDTHNRLSSNRDGQKIGK